MEIGYLPSGQKARGVQLKDKVLLDYFGQKGFVYKDYVGEGYKSTYLSQGANLRDTEGKILSYLPANQEITGIEYFDRIKISYKGEERSISNLYVKEKTFKKSFVSKGANIRNSRGKIVGYLKRGKTIEGVRKGNRIEFNYKGQIASINERCVK